MRIVNLYLEGTVETDVYKALKGRIRMIASAGRLARGCFEELDEEVAMNAACLFRGGGSPSAFKSQPPWVLTATSC